ncbi:MAG TPA: hypothetical protein VI111_10290 [Thermoleophilaceae bacterium]
MLLSEAVAAIRRLAIVGLAKNTGKTVALATMLRELEADGQTVGVTSIGNDGEQHDAIDERIAKPAIRLAAGSLVATTDLLLRRGSAPVELLRRTPYRTSLGRVVIARLRAAGALEVAGPVAAQDVGTVAEELIALGAERVLIDGALDRRASAAPTVADGVVVATGAVLDADIDVVVRKTKDAIDLLRLPTVDDPPLRRQALALRLSTLVAADVGWATSAGRESMGGGATALIAPPEQVALTRKLVLDGPVEEVAALLRAHPDLSCAIVKGALCEPFLEGVLRARRGEEFRIVVDDARRVFLTRRNAGFYLAHGIAIEVLTPIRVAAITVNPVAPLAHSFDSLRFRELVHDAAPGVPVFDVMHSSYTPE